MKKATRLFDYLDIQFETSPLQKALNYKVDGEWQSISTQEFKKSVDNYSLAYLAHNLTKNDKIAIISNNRPEWVMADLGMLQIGVVGVPIYPTSSINDYIYILNNSKIKLVFVSDLELFDKINQIKDQIPTLEAIYSFDLLPNCKYIDEFLESGNESYRQKLNELKDSIQIEDLATIIYTSGTTGNPKGVMLSHKNMIYNVETIAPNLPLKSGMRILSFLPLCHVFERVVSYLYYKANVEIYYSSIDELKESIALVKPHFFTCVPRLMEKIFEGMLAKADELTGIQKILYTQALQYAQKPKMNTGIMYSIYNKLIFSKWREAMGGNIVGIVTGAAALQAKLGIFFNNIGIMVREGYGMTETAPVISYNRFNQKDNKPGTVGLVLEGIEVKLDHRDGMEAGEGEILVKGDNVMMGYFENPDATNASIKDGWFYTGDVGKFIDKRFLTITDRVKELFKTSGGKYVAPQKLENKFKENRYIEQILIIGNDKKFVSALIYPSKTQLESWAKIKNYNINFDDKNWTSDERIQEKMNRVVQNINTEFSQVEQVKKFTLINNEWTIDSGELTPTLKPKRKIIEERYLDLINKMYS